jgi:AP-1-like factor
MDSQSFDYWMSQGNYITPPHQTTIFELPPDLSKVPSLSGSPVSGTAVQLRHRLSDPVQVSSTYDHFPAPIHQSYYPQIADEPMQFGSYPLPMTPSDFGSDHDSPYCSPRPPNHAEPVFAQTSASGPGERTHTTSGVSFASLPPHVILETNDPLEETSSKPRRSTCLPRA